MPPRLVRTVRWVLAWGLVATLLGCGDDRLSRLVPVLAAGDGSTVDSSHEAEYLLDFGEVVVGEDAIRTFFVRNLGRAPLTLQAPRVSAPFSAPELKSPETVPAQEQLGILLQFSPTVAGAAQTLVTLESDGGALTLRLIGTARAPQPTDCAFKVTPTALDFGNLSVGQAKTLSFDIENTGPNPCSVARLSLTGSTNDAFSIVGGAVESETVAAFSTSTVRVAFAPMLLGPTYSGGVQFDVGPPNHPQLVTLTGAVRSCPGALPDGSCPAAKKPIYVNDASTLYTWDASSNALTRIGDFGLASGDGMTDIAIDANGVMMGVALDDGLYVIDPNDAKCTRVGSLSDFANGLTFLPDGRLIASGDGVWVIDENNGNLTATIPSGGYDTSGDIIGLPDGSLYWSVSGSGNDQLVRLDPATGATSVIGDLGTTDVYGLAYADGTLYGFTAGGQVLTISVGAAGASVTQVRSLPGTWWGASTNPALWSQ